MRQLLYFSGRGWPGAQVAERVPSVQGLVIHTNGRGRDYQVRHPEGWWRDFAELDLSDEARVLSFVRRRGDPFEKLGPKAPIITTDWIHLRDALALAVNDPGQFRPSQWAMELGVTYEGLETVITAHTLAAYMAASAAASLRQKRPMLRCKFCSSWFTVNQHGAAFCSSSCRAGAGNKRVSPHARH